MTESIKYTTKSINLHLTQVVPCNIPIPNCTIYSGCNIIIHQSENSSKIWQFGDNSPYINLPVTFFGEVIMIHPDIYIYIYISKICSSHCIFTSYFHLCNNQCWTCTYFLSPSEKSGESLPILNPYLAHLGHALLEDFEALLLKRQEICLDFIA